MDFRMCGRFTSTASPEELMRHFGVTVLENLRPSWNVAPSHSALIFSRTRLEIETGTAQWGLPPATSKQSFLINARMETVTEKPTFRDAFATSRCIIPASGWYEWSAPKSPWHIQHSDATPMAVAGLQFHRGDHRYFVIVTSAADGDLQQIHHRAPLVLPQGQWEEWLMAPAEQARELCQPAPAHWFNWFRVTSAVGKVSENHPGLLTPMSEEEAADERSRLSVQAAAPRGKQDDNQGDLFG